MFLYLPAYHLLKIQDALIQLSVLLSSPIVLYSTITLISSGSILTHVDSMVLVLAVARVMNV